MVNFALIGAAGYIAPRHLQAIKDNGHRIIAATDPHTSVGLLDRYASDIQFFPQIEKFDKYLDELRKSNSDKVDWLSVCSPNHLHSAHIRMGLYNDCNVLCEKPLVLDPKDLDFLQLLEERTGKSIYTVLQLRLLPALKQLKTQLSLLNTTHDVVLTYITARGPWFHTTWKAQPELSGGIITNIGIHFLDLLIWLFGQEASNIELHVNDSMTAAGTMYLPHARVRWLLSIDRSKLPLHAQQSGKTTFREMLIDGNSIEFSDGFTELHTTLYQQTLNGNGFTIEDARPSVDLARHLRYMRLSPHFREEPHPLTLQELLGQEIR